MELHPDNPLDDPKQERQNTYAHFLIDLLDRRHGIERTIRKQGTYRGDYNYEGFHIDYFEPPEFLDSYVQAFNPVTIDVSASRSTSGTSHFDRIALYPEDDAPLSLEYDGTSTILRSAGEIVSVLANDSIEAILRQILPVLARDIATHDQILRYIGEASPAMTSTVEQDVVTDGLISTVSLSMIDTIDDSIETLSILRTLPHPSGNEVGLRISVTESLNRRLQTRNTNHVSRSATIEVIRPDIASSADWTVEELLRSDLDAPAHATVGIDVATRQHLVAIDAVLAALPQ